MTSLALSPNFTVAAHTAAMVAAAAPAATPPRSEPDKPNAAAGQTGTTTTTVKGNPDTIAIDAALKALIARILEGTPTATTAAGTGAGIILNLLSNPRNSAAAMDLNLNQLISNSSLQNLIKQLPPELLARPQVFEALVLQNTLLPASDNGASKPALPLLLLPNASAAAAQNTAASPVYYRVSVEWQNRLLQLLSTEPLPTGSRVQLQINARGEILLLPPDAATRIAAPQNPLLAQPAVPATPTAPTPLQTMQQSLRELMPREQALSKLVPLLVKFIQPAQREQLPPAITKAVAQLLQSLSKPAQLQNPELLKRAVSDSGSFFEGRLARAVLSAQTGAEAAEALPRIFAGDLKGQMAALLAVVRRFMPEQPQAAKNPLPGADDELVYSQKPNAHGSAAAPLHTQQSESMDSLLTQLSKLLQAGMARIQLNQLDSASARHLHTDAPQPVPTWILELPVRTPHGTDQLQLRIEQRERRQSGQVQQQVQWNVQLSFDLHAAGRIAASLAIVEKSVAATLWAEQEHTHSRVRQEMDYLRAGLESVGVRVTEMQCRLGLPEPRSNPLSQQLVDVHT